MQTETATFALGCFWAPDQIFSSLDGVIDVTVGFTGGHVECPSYDDVCAGTTGHAESVTITFDSEKVSYGKLLDVFWKNHNPTTPNRQGPDIGEQYRSAIYYHTEEQQELAIKSKELLEHSDAYKDPIVTEITEAGVFYPAEEYHQDFFKKKGINACPS